MFKIDSKPSFSFSELLFTRILLFQFKILTGPGVQERMGNIKFTKNFPFILKILSKASFVFSFSEVLLW